MTREPKKEPTSGETSFVPRPLGDADAPEPTPAPTSPPGRIGPYRILKTLGEGGMGAVYLARQEEPVRRQVALKLIKLGLDTHEVVARFQAERQALAVLNHANIARVYDGGATESGRPYFVMEHVPGISLEAHCDGHRLSIRERIGLFILICDAVQHAHQKGIIHRDLKPSNILVMFQEKQAIPKIIDFGVAKATNQRLTERTLFTEQGVIMGTPEYMSPEQAELSASDVDTRTDIYSLGAILYELLVGVLPFDAHELRQAGYFDMTRRIREEDPPRPSTRLLNLGEQSTTFAERRRTDVGSLSRALRGDLDWVIMKALEKDPARRYASASELAADLERYLNHESVLARPPTVTYRLSKFVRRNKGVVAAVASVVFALTAGLFLAIRSYLDAEEARGDAVISETLAKRMAADAEAARAETETSLEDARRSLAALFLEKSDRAFSRLEHRKAALYAAAAVDRWDSPGARGNLHRAWQSMIRRRWSVSLPRAKNFLLSRDGRYVALTAEQSVSIRELSTGSVALTLSDEESSLGEVVFAPSRNAFLVGGSNGPRRNSIQIWDLETGHRAGVLDGHSAPVRFFAVNSDGKRLVSRSDSSEAFLWDLETRTLITTLDGSVQDPSFLSPDGRRVATIRGRQISVHDLSAGEAILGFRARGAVQSVCFGSGGEWLASRSRDGLVEVWDLRHGTGFAVGDARLAGRGEVFFAAENKRVGAASSRFLRVWNLGRMRLGLPALVPEIALDEDVPHNLERDPSGQGLLWFADNDARYYRFPPGSQPLRLKVEHIELARFSPDGTTLGLLTSPNLLRFWNLTTERETGCLETSEVSDFAFSPDGRGFLTWRRHDDRDTWIFWEFATSTTALEQRQEGWIQGLAVGADGGVLAAATWDGVVLWDATRGEVLVSLGPSQTPVYCVTSDPGGRLFAAGAADATVRLWDATKGEPQQTIAISQNPVYALSFDPGGRWLAIAHGANSVRLWDLRAQLWGRSLVGHESQVFGITFSPRGSLLASASQDHSVRLWDTVSGREIACLRGHALAVTAVAFRSDGSQLVSASLDGTLRLWDVAAHSLIATLKGHRDRVWATAFSPDGEWIASGSDDRTVRLWNVARGVEVARLSDHAGPVLALAFSPDGKWLASGSQDATVRLSNLEVLLAPAAEILAQAERLTGFSLDDEFSP